MCMRTQIQLNKNRNIHSWLYLKAPAGPKNQHAFSTSTLSSTWPPYKGAQSIYREPRKLKKIPKPTELNLYTVGTLKIIPQIVQEDFLK